ncbi:MAG: hypothetical protein JO249_15905 [Acidobacteria bacterium]|nr:hypothetical protein [Acidobacteriota bacterium]
MRVRDPRIVRLTAPLVALAGSVLLASGQEALPATPPLTDSIVERLMTTRDRQARQLRAIDAVRNYRLDYHGLGGTRHAEMQVVSTYTAPHQKEFRIVSESGSRFLLDRILKKLLDSEKDYQLDDSDSDLSPRNYHFQLLGTDEAAGSKAYVIEITPRRRAKYLCRGKIWVDARDFAIARLEGEPAKNPSFWVSHTEMANTYQKVGDYWLPVHKDATSEVRFGGKAVLAIDYSGYQITANPRSELQASSGTSWHMRHSDPRTSEQP